MKIIYSIILLFLLIHFDCNDNRYINDDFLEDLSAEDNRMWGELYLDVFNGDFHKLTFNYYMAYLDSTQHTSAEGLSEKIKAADLILLKSENDTFWILLYYKNENLIIADNASTDIGTADTTIIYTDKTVVPDLSFYAKSIIKN